MSDRSRSPPLKKICTNTCSTPSLSLYCSDMSTPVVYAQKKHHGQQQYIKQDSNVVPVAHGDDSSTLTSQINMMDIDSELKQVHIDNPSSTEMVDKGKRKLDEKNSSSVSSRNAQSPTIAHPSEKITHGKGKEIEQKVESPGHGNMSTESQQKYESSNKNDVVKGGHSPDSEQRVESNGNGKSTSQEEKRGPYDSIILFLKTADESLQHFALSEMCRILPLAIPSAMRTFPLETILPELQGLIMYQHNPELKLLSLRAVRYLCDLLPLTVRLLVKQGEFIPQICQNLLSIQYIDLSEEYLGILSAIASHYPLQCLQSGALSAILAYFDFHPTGVQRTAISTAAEMCRNIPKDAFKFLESSIPTLTSLLHYPDINVVEYACLCFMRMVKSFGSSSAKLDTICSNGLVSEATRIIAKTSQKSVSNSTHNMLIGILSKCAAKSSNAVEILLDMDICGILKEILTGSKLEIEIPADTLLHMVNIIKCLISIVCKHKKHAILENFLDHHKPNLLVQYGKDILAILLQIYERIPSPSDRHSCVNTIYKFVICLPTKELVLSVLEDIDTSAFLVGLFATKDFTIQLKALEIADFLMKKHQGHFSEVFVREGLVEAINNCFHLDVETTNTTKMETDISTNETKEGLESQALEAAKRFKSTYFHGDSIDKMSEKLNKLKSLCSRLESETTIPIQNSKTINCILAEILTELGTEEDVSTYEFLKCRLTDSLLNFFCVSSQTAESVRKEAKLKLHQFFIVAMRHNEKTMTPYLTVIVRKLQNALASLECFALNLSDQSTQMSLLSRPLNLQFVKDPLEKDSQDHTSAGFPVTVPPFVTLASIEEQLLPKVKQEDPTKEMKPFPGGKLSFYAGGQMLNMELTVLEAIRYTQDDNVNKTGQYNQIWGKSHVIHYQLADDKSVEKRVTHTSAESGVHSAGLEAILDSVILKRLPGDMGNFSPAYNILLLLSVLHGINHYQCAQVRIPEEEFLNPKLVNKITCQMQDALAICSGSMPSWCHQLMEACPFLFPFETRREYLQLTAFGLSRAVIHLHKQKNGSGQENHNWPSVTTRRKKFNVPREQILSAARQVMDRCAGDRSILEFGFHGEMGSGIGPTLEFYTLASQELQKSSLGMWRHYVNVDVSDEGLESNKLSSYVPYGLFPRPLKPDSKNYSRVIDKFLLLGHIVGKALEDGHLLDLPLATAFYKLMLGHQLDLCDIKSFDLELGSALEEMLKLALKKDLSEPKDLLFRGTKIENLCLDFTLPGYPEYVLKPGGEDIMVNSENLEEYISLIVDASLRQGILQQVDAFRKGFNEVFPLSSLQIFNEEELSEMLCGKHEMWLPETLKESIRFDYGYNAQSPPVINLLEIMTEFNPEQQKRFLQFVTGAPKLPCGGLSALNPKLTVVRKVTDDGELPSVMTCTHYLKLPPYSSKEVMRNRLIFAMYEGQGSFDLS